jgi:hypothetical protein
MVYEDVKASRDDHELAKRCGNDARNTPTGIRPAPRGHSGYAASTLTARVYRDRNPPTETREVP